MEPGAGPGGGWSSARALWALRGLPELAGEFAARLDAVVGLASRMLLTPLGRWDPGAR